MTFIERLFFWFVLFQVLLYLLITVPVYAVATGHNVQAPSGQFYFFGTPEVGSSGDSFRSSCEAAGHDYIIRAREFGDDPGSSYCGNTDGKDTRSWSGCAGSSWCYYNISASSWPYSGINTVGNPQLASCDAYPEVCSVVYPPDCPAQGTKTSVAYVVNGVFVDGSFIQTSTDGVIEIGGSVVDSETECEYAFGTGENYQAAKCEVFDEGSAICFQDLYATGGIGTPSDNQYQVVTADTSPNSEGDGKTDTRVNTKTVNVSDPILSTDPDGTNVTTSQTATVETRGDGTQVSTQEETVFISESDGIIHEQIETTTTYEFPDGTTQVDTEIRDSYTQTPITNYTVNTTDGRISIDASGGSSSSTVTNITNNYAADGSLTGSSETTSTEGDSEIVEEEQQKSECEENSMSKECTGEFTKTDKGGFKSDFEQGSALWHYNQATTELQTMYDTIQSEITAELGLTLSGGGTSIESDPLYWHGQEFSSGGGIANLISWFDFMNISTLVLLVFGLVSFFILVRD